MRTASWLLGVLKVEDAVHLIQLGPHLLIPVVRRNKEERVGQHTLEKRDLKLIDRVGNGGTRISLVCELSLVGRDSIVPIVNDRNGD